MALVALDFGAAAVAAADDGLGDLLTRIDYGFYSEAPASIAAAVDELEQRDDDDDTVRYLRAFAALRQAQLDALAGRGGAAGNGLARCVELAEPAEVAERDQPIRVTRERDAAAAEAWALVAACAALAANVEPARSASHGRRSDQALARARSADPRNPRSALVAAWRVSVRPAAASDPEIRTAAATALQAAIDAFAEAQRSANPALPSWGEAEALAALAELRASQGARREARDLVERALLAVPGYAFAEALAAELRGN